MNSEPPVPCCLLPCRQLHGRRAAMLISPISSYLHIDYVCPFLIHIYSYDRCISRSCSFSPLLSYPCLPPLLPRFICCAKRGSSLLQVPSSAPASLSPCLILIGFNDSQCDKLVQSETFHPSLLGSWESDRLTLPAYVGFISDVQLISHVTKADHVTRVAISS